MQNFSENKMIGKLLNWKFFLLCNSLVLIIKILFSVYHHFEAEHFEDWSIAENLTVAHIYSLDVKYGSSAYKLPVYPLFLSSYMKIFGIDQAARFIILTQHVFYFIIPLVLIRFFENLKLKNAGFLSGYFFIFSPAYFYYSNVLEATNIFILLFVIWMYAYSLFWIRPVSFKHILLLSVLTALVSLTQVVAVPVMLLLLLALGFYKKVSLKNLLAVILIAGAGYSPWVIRNYLTFDKIIMSKSPVWQNVYLGYIPDHQILYGDRFVSEKEKQAIFARISRHNEFEDEVIYENEVKRIVTDDKMAPYKKALNNLVSLWFVPKKYFNDNGLSVLIGRKCYAILINLLLFVSLAYFFKKDKRLFFFLCIVFAGFTMPYLIGHAANIRFKLDFEWIQTSVIALFISTYFLENRKSSYNI